MLPNLTPRRGRKRNRYKPHYTGRRQIAAERNRNKILAGKIPNDQVLRRA
jgi:hypothetical protein